MPLGSSRGSQSRSGSLEEGSRARDGAMPSDTGYGDLVSQLARGVLESSMREYLARNTYSIPPGRESVIRDFFGLGAPQSAAAPPDQRELTTQLVLHAIEFFVRSYLRVLQRRRTARAVATAEAAGPILPAQQGRGLLGSLRGGGSDETNMALDNLAAEVQATLAALDGLTSRPCGQLHTDGNCDMQAELRAEIVRLRGGLDNLLSSVNTIRNLELGEVQRPRPRLRLRGVDDVELREGSERRHLTRALRGSLSGGQDVEQSRLLRESGRERGGVERENGRGKAPDRTVSANSSIGLRPPHGHAVRHRSRSRDMGIGENLRETRGSSHHKHVVRSH